MMFSRDGHLFVSGRRPRERRWFFCVCCAPVPGAADELYRRIHGHQGSRLSMVLLRGGFGVVAILGTEGPCVLEVPPNFFLTASALDVRLRRGTQCR
jgi:hypothetical protein